jgi:hypothetical protein
LCRHASDRPTCGGFLFRLAYGLIGLDSAKSLERYLHSVIAGVAADHGLTR